jgi:hypothetical protein
MMPASLFGYVVGLKNLTYPPLTLNQTGFVTLTFTIRQDEL